MNAAPALVPRYNAWRGELCTMTGLSGVDSPQMQLQTPGGLNRLTIQYRGSGACRSSHAIPSSSIRSCIAPRETIITTCDPRHTIDTAHTNTVRNRCSVQPRSLHARLTHTHADDCASTVIQHHPSAMHNDVIEGTDTPVRTSAYASNAV